MIGLCINPIIVSCGAEVMENILPNLLNGITFGFILFLIASGLSVIYGFMGILNLAHGVFYILGAYFGLAFYDYGVPFVLASLGAGIVVGIIAMVVERVFLSRLHKQIDEQVLLTIGFVYIFTTLARLIWGSEAQLVAAPAIVSGFVNIGDIRYPLYRLVIIGAGLAIAAGLWLLTERTRAGSIVRAGMDNKEMTTALGMNYALVSSIIFFMGALVGGAAGFIGLPIIAVHPAIVWDILLLSLIVIVVGGVGRIEGVLLGSMVIGLIDSLGKAYFPDWSYFTIYLAMIVILLVKPRGLLPRSQ